MTEMTDVEKIRVWLNEAHKINTDYVDDCKDIEKLISMCRILLDATSHCLSDYCMGGCEKGCSNYDAIEKCAKVIE